MMYTTEQVAKKANVSTQTVGAWARKLHIEKIGRDYLYTEKQYKAFQLFHDKDPNLKVPNGAALLSKEFGVTREAITENARKLGISKVLVDGRMAYVFNAKQKEELRRKICRK